MRGAKVPEHPESDKAKPVRDDAYWRARMVGIALSKLERGQDREAAARFMADNALRLYALLTSREEAAKHALGTLTDIPKGDPRA